MTDHELLRYVDAETRRLGLEEAIGKDALQATLHSPITIEHAAASWEALNCLRDVATGRPLSIGMLPSIGDMLNTPGFLEHWADLRVRFSSAMHRASFANTLALIAKDKGQAPSNPLDSP